MSNQNSFINKLVFVIDGNGAISRIFKDKGAVLCDHIKQADIVVYSGGADVSPELYKEQRHPTTHPNPARDKWETACFLKARHWGKLQVGICRGGQFLNVMNGGSLWQDVDNHAIPGEHPMKYKEFVSESTSVLRHFDVTSTHHQQIIPNVQIGAKIWGFAGISTRKTAGILLKDKRWVTVTPQAGHTSDCEIVYYPSSRSLCFQPHPEYGSKSTRDLFFLCVERALTGIA